MGTTRLDTFEQSLGSVGATCRQTTSTEFGDLVAELVEEPAVGTPLPFEGVSYEDTPVVDLEEVEFDALKTGVTPVALGIATYGSVVVASTAAGEEPVALYPDRHVVVLAESDIVEDMPEAFDWLGDRIRATGDDCIIATGSSATADMGDLVLGAHGPQEVVVVLRDQ